MILIAEDPHIGFIKTTSVVYVLPLTALKIQTLTNAVPKISKGMQREDHVEQTLHHLPRVIILILHEIGL